MAEIYVKKSTGQFVPPVFNGKRVFQQCFKDIEKKVSKVFQEILKVVSEKFQGCGNKTTSLARNATLKDTSWAKMTTELTSWNVPDS